MYFPLPCVFRFDDTFHKQSPSLFVVCLSVCAHLQHFMRHSSWNKMDAWVNRYLLQSVTLFFFFRASLENSLCDSETKTQRETHTQSHTDVSLAKAAPREPVVSPQTFVTVWSSETQHSWCIFCSRYSKSLPTMTGASIRDRDPDLAGK